MTQLSRMQRQIDWNTTQIKCLDEAQVSQNNIVIPISVNYTSTTQTLLDALNNLTVDVAEEEILFINATDTNGIDDFKQYLFRPGKGNYGVGGIEILWSHLQVIVGGGELSGNYLPLSGGTVTGGTYYTYDSSGEGWNGDEIANHQYVYNNYMPLSESGTAGENLSVGNIVYQNTTTYVWLKATATDITKCIGKIGIVAVAGNIGQTIGVKFRVQYNTSGLVKGTLIYIGENPGTYTIAPPTGVDSYAVLIGKANDTDSISYDFHTLSAVASDGSSVNGVPIINMGTGGDAYLANTQTFLGVNTFTNKVIVTAPDLTPEIEFIDVNGYAATVGIVNPTTKDFEIIKQSGVKFVSDKTYISNYAETINFASFSLLGAYVDINTTALQDSQGATSKMIVTNEYLKQYVNDIDYSNFALLNANNEFVAINTFNENLIAKKNINFQSSIGGDQGSIEHTDSLLTINVPSAGEGLLAGTWSTSLEVIDITDGKQFTSVDWVQNYVNVNDEGFLRNVHEDLDPFLGGELRTANNEIVITDISNSIVGLIGNSVDNEAYFVRSIDGNYDTNDGGVLLGPGSIEVHGAITQINSLVGTDNRQVYANELGGLFAVPAPIPGWVEVDTDNADYTLTGIGTTWVKMTGLEIACFQDVLINTTLQIVTNLHILNNSATSGGNILIGFGVNGADPTLGGVNIRVEGNFNSLVPVVLSTTQHGGLSATDTITVFARRETEDSAPFDPEIHGSTAPIHELNVSVPTIASGGSGIYSFVFPLVEAGGTVTLNETNFAKTNIAETFDSTLTVADYLTIGTEKDVKLTSTTNSLATSLSASRLEYNSTSAGVWSLPAIDIKHGGTTQTQIGGYGNVGTFNYGFLGTAYNDTSIKWFDDGSVVINGTTDSIVEHAGFNFYVNGLAKFANVVSGQTPTLDEHLVTKAYVDSKFTPALTDTIVKTTNYTTLLTENDFIIELTSAATTVTLDNGDKPVGFRQQILNNTGADITFSTANPVVGENIPLADGLFAYYVILADGVTWGLSVGNESTNNGSTYTFTSPLVDTGGIVTFDETDFAKTDIRETFDEGLNITKDLLIQKSYLDGLDFLNIKTSTGVDVLTVSNGANSNAAPRARFTSPNLQFEMQDNFVSRQLDISKPLIHQWRDSANGTVAGIYQDGRIFWSADPTSDIEGVNKGYGDANYITEIEDTLTSQSPTLALSANQGFILNGLINNKADADTVLVYDIIAGTNISINKTDPNNPIISASFTVPTVDLGTDDIDNDSAIVTGVTATDAIDRLDTIMAKLAGNNTFTGFNTFNQVIQTNGGINSYDSYEYLGSSTTDNIIKGRLNLGAYQQAIDFRSVDETKRLSLANAMGVNGEFAGALGAITNSDNTALYLTGTAEGTTLGTNAVVEVHARRIAGAAVGPQEKAFRIISGISYNEMLVAWGDGTITAPTATNTEITNRGDQTLITKAYADAFYAGGGGGTDLLPLDNTWTGTNQYNQKTTHILGLSVNGANLTGVNNIVSSGGGTNIATYAGVTQMFKNVTCSGGQNIGTYAIPFNQTFGNYIKAKVNIAVGKETASEALDVVGNIVATGSITSLDSYDASDARLKNNIVELDDTFRSFTMKHDEKNRTKFGVIAQDLEIDYPDLVKTDKNGFLAVDYNSVLSLELSKAKARITTLEDTIKDIYDKLK